MAPLSLALPAGGPREGDAAEVGVALLVHGSLCWAVMACPSPAHWPLGLPVPCLSLACWPPGLPTGLPVPCPLACWMMPSKVSLPPLAPFFPRGCHPQQGTPAGGGVTCPLSQQEASSA